MFLVCKYIFAIQLDGNIFGNSMKFINSLFLNKTRINLSELYVLNYLKSTANRTFIIAITSLREIN